MRGLLIFLWAAAIFIFTCTSNFDRLVQTGQIQFHWSIHPSFANFFEPFPFLLDKSFLLQKMGHLTAFFIFTYLLQTKFHSKWLILSAAISYAMLTECLQLFFSRDGRLFDIGIDLIGILLASGLASFSRGSHVDNSV